MNFYLNYVVPKKNLNINKEKSDLIIINNEYINAFDEKQNFPKEMPKPISLEKIINYYNKIWKKKKY